MRTTNHRTTAARALSAGMALALFAGHGLAAAHDGDHDKGPEPVSAEEAWLTDAEIVAKSKDWTVEQALERAQLQEVLGDIADRTARQHPEVFTSAIMPDQPGDPAVMRFVREVPDEVRKLVDEARIDVEFDTSARFSDVELVARADDLRDVLAEQGFEDVVTAISPAGTVEVQVAAGRVEPKLPRALRANTELQLVERVEFALEHDRGGARVTVNGGGGCTSGWSVRDVDTGVRGVTTAGHCTGINTFHEPDLNFTYDLDHELQHVGSLGDIEWKTSEHVTRAEFWANENNQLRDVLSVESWWGFLFGGTYCVYGRSSNDRECDDLYRRDVSAGGTGSMHAMEEDNTIPGDSGGGWSFNNEAAGGHIGDLVINGQTRNVFSQARLFDSAIGVEVLTK